MFKARRADRTMKRRRTSLEIEEEQSRTLYIRVPHTIKNIDEIKSLFFGDFRVKLPRQSTRYCHVIFNDVEDKIKNLKAVKKKLIDGKPIYAGPPKPMNLEKKKKPKQKKVKVPDPSTAPKLGKYIFVSNIPPGVKASEVKDAFPGSVTVALLKGLVKGKRNAKVKMSSHSLCLHYTKKENRPVLKEQKVTVRLGKTSSSNNNKIKKQKKTESLKIYDGENDQKEKSTVKDSDSKKADSAGSDEEDEEGEEDEEDEVSEEEDEDTEEEEEEESNEEKEE